MMYYHQVSPMTVKKYLQPGESVPILPRGDGPLTLGCFNTLAKVNAEMLAVWFEILRQLPGALNDAESASQDSFVNGILDYPHYTRPELYGDEAVPAVLLSGNHADIARWRLKQALGRTWQRRPDLLEKRGLSAEERKLLEEFRNET